MEALVKQLLKAWINVIFTMIYKSEICSVSNNTFVGKAAFIMYAKGGAEDFLGDLKI